MTTAFDYEDVHRLVDRLTPAQVRRLRLLIARDEELARAAETLTARSTREQAVLDGLPALIGAVNGPQGPAGRRDEV